MISLDAIRRAALPAPAFLSTHKRALTGQVTLSKETPSAPPSGSSAEATNRDLRRFARAISSANKEFSAALDISAHSFWSDPDSSQVASENRRYFAAAREKWVNAIVVAMKGCFRRLSDRARKEKNHADPRAAIRCVLDKYCKPAEFLKKIEILPNLPLPPGVSDKTRKELARELFESVATQLDQIADEPPADIIRGEEIARYVSELRHIEKVYGHKRRRPTYQELRKRFPTFELWRGIDDSGRISPEMLREFFTVSPLDCFDLAGKIMGLSRSRANDLYKKYREHSGLQRRRQPQAAQKSA